MGDIIFSFQNMLIGHLYLSFALFSVMCMSSMFIFHEVIFFLLIHVSSLHIVDNNPLIITFLCNFPHSFTF